MLEFFIGFAVGGFVMPFIIGLLIVWAYDDGR